MTEAKWFACEDPATVLYLFRGKGAERKLRLFAVACCRLLLQKVRLHPWYSHGIAVAEKFADGEATVQDLEVVRRYPSSDWCLQHAIEFDVNEVTAQGQPAGTAIAACWNVMETEDVVAAADCASTNAAWAATQPGSVMPKDNGVSAGRLAAELAIQVNVLRDIFGNPFRPVTFSPAWRTDTVLALARQMYEAREFGTMPILADALQDAGCDNDDVLNHCRDVNAAHVRGCWVVDLVLGKE